MRRGLFAAAFAAMVGPTNLFSAQQQDGARHVHPFHANHVAVFGGATSQPHDEGTHATLGVDYVRRLGAGRWGVGFGSEVVFAGHTEWILAGTVTLFPWRGIALRGGLGVELFQEAAPPGAQSATTASASVLLRAGAGYAFPVGGFTVAPVAMIDFVRNTDTFVWGIEVGKGF